MLDICDVREEWLPGLYESSEKTGTLKADVACELGFPKDCIVAALSLIHIFYILKCTDYLLLLQK